MSSAPFTVRITVEEQQAIRRAIARGCQQGAASWSRILLFGSRTDPTQRGGDIDLLMELAAAEGVDTYRLDQYIRLALEDELGERKIDLLIDDGHHDEPFIALARERGVTLWENP